MSTNIIFVLMYHRHKLLDLIIFFTAEKGSNMLSMALKLSYQKNL
jgi:hypothetical protein